MLVPVPIIVALAEVVEKEARFVPVFLRQSVLSLPALVMMVWSLVLFDMLGDATGFDKAIWILVTIAVMAILVHRFCGGKSLFSSLCNRIYWAGGNKSNNRRVDEGLAMNEIKPSYQSNQDEE